MSGKFADVRALFIMLFTWGVSWKFTVRFFATDSMNPGLVYHSATNGGILLYKYVDGTLGTPVSGHTGDSDSGVIQIGTALIKPV